MVLLWWLKRWCAMGFYLVDLHYAPRRCNGVANKLAKFAFSSNYSCTWMNSYVSYLDKFQMES